MGRQCVDGAECMGLGVGYRDATLTRSRCKITWMADGWPDWFAARGHEGIGQARGDAGVAGHREAARPLTDEFWHPLSFISVGSTPSTRRRNDQDGPANSP